MTQEQMEIILDLDNIKILSKEKDKLHLFKIGSDAFGLTFKTSKDFEDYLVQHFISEDKINETPYFISYGSSYDIKYRETLSVVESYIEYELDNIIKQYVPEMQKDSIDAVVSTPSSITVRLNTKFSKDVLDKFNTVAYEQL